MIAVAGVEDAKDVRARLEGTGEKREIRSGTGEGSR